MRKIKLINVQIISIVWNFYFIQRLPLLQWPERQPPHRSLLARLSACFSPTPRATLNNL